MSLTGFFNEIAPFLHGHRGLDETVSALYGQGDGGAGQTRQHRARRLGIYGRFCRLHRHQVLESVYLHVHAQLLRLVGEAAWSELVGRYFLRHPMRHFELNANGGDFPEFLAEHVAVRGWPSYLAELADFEWWEWQTLIAADEPADRETVEETGARLRLASTVELRPYRHDLIGWLDDQSEGGDRARPPLPQPRDTLVLFWRDRERDTCRDRATPIELAVLKAVHEGSFPAALAASGMPLDAARATLADLHAAGIVLGRL